MKKRIGLIDLGSNTFHLVIAAMTKKSLEIIFHKRAYVYLAQSGIKTIADEAIKRGIETVAEFYDICTNYKVDDIIAVGTSALRSASNSRDFTSAILERFDIRTQIIDGQREADLTYQGMAMTSLHHKQQALFMDIGGGSIEFTLTHNDHKVFQKSLPIGLGVLKNTIPFSDPVLPAEIINMNRFLDREARSLINQLRIHPPKTLIGGSGTFDVLAEALTRESFDSNNFSTIDPAEVYRFITNRIESTLAERIQDKLIPDERVHLIVHSFLLIKWILDQRSFLSVAFSKYALKEGLLQEYYEEWVRTI